MNTPPELDEDLAQAISRGEMFAYFQPQLDLSTGKIESAEALCRWMHPVLGVLAPDIFIPMAEESGVIHEIGRFIVDEGCRFASTWNARGIALEVSVNVSAAQLTTSFFTDRLVRLVEESGLPEGSLTIEVTESQPIVDLPSVAARLVSLRMAGIGVSIDDYGVGHTSPSQLRSLPLTEVKIDQSVVRQETVGADILAETLVALAHEIGLRVVAEGVETAEQLQRVRDLGCDRAQGYLIGMPMSADDLERLVLAQR